jgi:low affinity Fe/Cu permease
MGKRPTGTPFEVDAGKQTREPVNREPTTFDRFAEHATRFVSQGLFFTICFLVVVVWMPTILIFQSVDTWQLVINTLTSVLAFLLIALLQNSERRYDEALHRKIDALAAAVAALVEERDGERPDARERAEELRKSIGLERKV